MESYNQSLGHKLIVGSGYSYLALLVSRTITTIATIFLARFLGPTNLGMISIVNYLLLLFLFMTGFGIPTACVKLITEYNLKDKTNVGRFITSTFIFNLIIIIIITSLYYLIASFLAQSVYREVKLTELIKISAIALFFFSLNQYGNAIIQAFTEFKKLSFILIFNSGFGLLMLIPLTKLWGLKGTALSQVVTSIATFLVLIRVIRIIKIKHSITRFFNVSFLTNVIYNFRIDIMKMVRLAFPVFLSGLVMTPALVILTTLLTRIRSFTEVGFFNIAYSLTQIILFVPTAVGTPFIPLVTRLALEEPKKLKDFLIKTIYGVNFIVIGLSFFIAFFSKEIIHLFYGTKFLPVQNILIVLLIATFLSSFGYIIGYYFLALGKMWLATALNFLWFILIVAPAYHFIKFFGLAGLGLGYFVSYIVLTTIFIFYLKKQVKVNIGKLMLHLTGGVFLLTLLYFMKLHNIAYIFQFGILVLFVIFMYYFFRLLKKSWSSEFIVGLISNKIKKYKFFKPYVK